MQALADISSGKKKVLVPYRDSILTKLLQNALGGNRSDLCNTCYLDICHCNELQSFHVLFSLIVLRGSCPV